MFGWDWADRVVCARGGDIFLGTAVEVGGSENRAPTVTPTALPTATATPPWWEAPTPASPPVMMPPDGPPPDIDLAGIDAVLRVDAVYAGDPGAEFATGEVARSSIERALREWEARVGGPVSSCELDSFVPRYEAGGQYLLFVEEVGRHYGVRLVRIGGVSCRRRQICCPDWTRCFHRPGRGGC